MSLGNDFVPKMPIDPGSLTFTRTVRSTSTGRARSCRVRTDAGPPTDVSRMTVDWPESRVRTADTTPVPDVVKSVFRTGVTASRNGSEACTRISRVSPVDRVNMLSVDHTTAVSNVVTRSLTSWSTTLTTSRQPCRYSNGAV